MPKIWYAINSDPKREVCAEVGKRQQMEYKVISAFVKTALAAGHSIGVDDGDDLVLEYSRSYKEVMGKIMSTDEDYIIVYPVGATKGPRLGWAHMVYGNDGPDVINDCSMNILHLMGQAEKVSDQLYKKLKVV